MLQSVSNYFSKADSQKHRAGPGIQKESLKMDVITVPTVDGQLEIGKPKNSINRFLS